MRAALGDGEGVRLLIYDCFGGGDIRTLPG